MSHEEDWHLVVEQPDDWSNAVAGAWRENEWAERLPRAVRGARRFQLRQARALAAIDVARHHRFEGCASMEEYGLRFGLGPRETRDLTRLGLLLRRLPEVVDAFEKGRLSLESASSLYVALLPVEDRPPDANRPDAAWFALACATAPREFGDLVRRVRAELRTGRSMLRISVLLSDQTLDRWKRAKKVLRHMRKRSVSEDELLGLLCEGFLNRHDPARVPSRTRRVVSGPDAQGRHVPAAVQRAVIERDGLQCRHPGCAIPGPFHFGHIEPYAEGGPNTADNLILECAVHNDLVRLGLIRLVGPAWNPGFQYRNDPGAPWGCVDRPYWMGAEERRERWEKIKGLDRDLELVAGPAVAQAVGAERAGWEGHSPELVPSTTSVGRFGCASSAAVLPASAGPAVVPDPTATRPGDTRREAGRTDGGGGGEADTAARGVALSGTKTPPDGGPGDHPGRAAIAASARADGYRTEPLITIPYVDARDPAKLRRWLDDWFRRAVGPTADGAAEPTSERVAPGRRSPLEDGSAAEPPPLRPGDGPGSREASGASTAAGTGNARDREARPP